VPGALDDLDLGARDPLGASVEAATGIGLREPCTKPTGTRIPGSPASSAGSSAWIEGTISAERAVAIRSSGIGGACSGSAIRRPDEAHPLERQLVARVAGHRRLMVSDTVRRQAQAVSNL
jgi:hypothetical protein